MPPTKKVSMPPMQPDGADDKCIVTMDNIGKLIEANIRYIAKNQGTSPFLVHTYGKAIREDYPKNCQVPFEQNMSNISNKLSQQVQTECVPLPTATEVQKCVEKIEESNPIVWINKLQFLLIQEEMAQKEIASAMQMPKKPNQGDNSFFS